MTLALCAALALLAAAPAEILFGIAPKYRPD